MHDGSNNNVYIEDVSYKVSIEGLNMLKLEKIIKACQQIEKEAENIITKLFECRWHCAFFESKISLKDNLYRVRDAIVEYLDVYISIRDRFKRSDAIEATALNIKDLAMVKGQKLKTTLSSFIAEIDELNINVCIYIEESCRLSDNITIIMSFLRQAAKEIKDNFSALNSIFGY